MRKRWIYPKDGEPFEVTQDYTPESVAPLIFGDLPGYQSPVTGLWVEGRVQRREDLKRTGSRPWEGMTQERKEADRQKQYMNQHVENSLHENAMRSYHELPPSKRRILEKS